jgi:sugar lactone lactonase YvrE
VEAIPGTELSAPNGIEVSPDGRTLYVAVFGTHEFVRFRRGPNGLEKMAVPVAISPDNVRWAPNGKLLTVGSNYSGPAAPRTTAWTVLEVDPDTLSIRPVAQGASSRGMQALSVGLAVEGGIWVGTYAGDRVGIVKTQ